MSRPSRRQELIGRIGKVVAELGPLVRDVVLVGGCAIALYDLGPYDVGETKDLDLVIKGSYARWTAFMTELDAFQDRGKGDPCNSKDVEDVLLVLRGLPSVLDEVEHGGENVHRYIRYELGKIANRQDALDVVRANLEPDEGSQAQAKPLLDRLRRVAPPSTPDWGR